VEAVQVTPTSARVVLDRPAVLEVVEAPAVPRQPAALVPFMMPPTAAVVGQVAAEAEATSDRAEALELAVCTELVQAAAAAQASAAQRWERPASLLPD
jgi:hypothetical protein